MLYSIGYQKLRGTGHLVRRLKEHNINFLVDVRSRPYGRRHVFNKNQLEKVLPENGIQYIWMGRSLGGFKEISESAIAWLASWQENKIACLMCMEADPNICHRKYDIGRRLINYDVQVEHLIT